VDNCLIIGLQIERKKRGMAEGVRSMLFVLKIVFLQLLHDEQLLTFALRERMGKRAHDKIHKRGNNKNNSSK
jgi:hypothetical protein